MLNRDDDSMEYNMKMPKITESHNSQFTIQIQSAT